MERYILQPSEKEGYFVCTDQLNLIVCAFEAHKFNDNQKFSLLENFDTANYMQLARLFGEMGDWLRENHYDKIF